MFNSPYTALPTHESAVPPTTASEAGTHESVTGHHGPTKPTGSIDELCPELGEWWRNDERLASLRDLWLVTWTTYYDPHPAAAWTKVFWPVPRKSVIERSLRSLKPGIDDVQVDKLATNLEGFKAIWWLQFSLMSVFMIIATLSDEPGIQWVHIIWIPSLLAFCMAFFNGAVSFLLHLQRNLLDRGGAQAEAQAQAQAEGGTMHSHLVSGHEELLWDVEAEEAEAEANGRRPTAPRDHSNSIPSPPPPPPPPYLSSSTATEQPSRSSTGTATGKGGF